MKRVAVGVALPPVPDAAPLLRVAPVHRLLRRSRRPSARRGTPRSGAATAGCSHPDRSRSERRSRRKRRVPGGRLPLREHQLLERFAEVVEGRRGSKLRHVWDARVEVQKPPIATTARLRTALGMIHVGRFTDGRQQRPDPPPSETDRKRKYRRGDEDDLEIEGRGPSARGRFSLAAVAPKPSLQQSVARSQRHVVSSTGARSLSGSHQSRFSAYQRTVSRRPFSHPTSGFQPSSLRILLESSR
jgi:hypothetical protein